MGREYHPAPRGRIFVVEDDPDTARFISRVLEKRGGFRVEHAPSPAAALPRLRAERWDLVITDIEMPDMSGIELLESLRDKAPALPVAVITAHVTAYSAVAALRGRAAEFMQKPLRPDSLMSAVSRLIERGRGGRASVLAVGAHPGDAEVGAAGALLAHRAAGHHVAILTMSHGGPDDERAGQARDAAAILGAELYLEDTRISESDPTVRAVRALVEAVQPTIVYAHSVHDVHQDHCDTHRAVMAAAGDVASVFCYQSPSATVDFRPARFIAIDDFITTKLAAIGAFGSQTAVPSYLEPGLIEATARYWSRFGGCRHAEAFEVVRDHAAGPAIGFTTQEAAQKPAHVNITSRENAAAGQDARQIPEAGHAIT